MCLFPIPLFFFLSQTRHKQLPQLDFQGIIYRECECWIPLIFTDLSEAKDPKVLGRIPLSDAHICVSEDNTGKLNTFEIATTNRIFYLVASCQVI